MEASVFFSVATCTDSYNGVLTIYSLSATCEKDAGGSAII